MARQIINNVPSGSGLGDTLYIAFGKINAMTEELYSSGSLLASEVDQINTVLQSISDGSLLNHTHTIAQIQNLQSTLDSKVSTILFNSQNANIANTIATINTTLNSIIDILNTKVGEAPIDGTQYARQDGNWVQVSGSSVDLSGYVPYSGSTQDVNLGINSLSGSGIFTDRVQFNTASVEISQVGKLKWNDTDGTLDLGLKGGNVTLQIGQEQVIRVVNKTSPLVDLLEANYQVCVISGATGQRVSVRLAQANNDTNSAGTLGVVTETILSNQEGFITTNGQVKEINTTGALQGETWNDGDVLYLSPTVPGAITNVKPIAPNHTVIVGYVEYAHAVHGKIFVKIDNGYELDELHNVSISTGVTSGDTLMYSGSVWTNVDPFNYFDAKPLVYQKHVNMPTIAGASINNIEGVALTVGNPLARNWANTNLVTRTQRLGLVVSTTGNAAQIRQTITYFDRQGGFDLITGFNMAENANDAVRAFIGVTTNTGTFGNTEPNTLLNIVGFCRLSTSNNIHLVHNDNSGTGTTVDLGVNFPGNTISTDKYFVYIKSVPTGIYVKIERVGTTFSYENILTTDIPSLTTALNFGMYVVDVAGPSVATGIDFYGSYIKI